MKEQPSGQRCVASRAEQKLRLPTLFLHRPNTPLLAAFYKEETRAGYPVACCGAVHFSWVFWFSFRVSCLQRRDSFFLYPENSGITKKEGTGSIKIFPKGLSYTENTGNACSLNKKDRKKESTCIS